MKWFKFYGQDWLTDIKIIQMTVEDRLCYLTLLCLASAEDKDGIVSSCDENTLIKLAHIPDDPFHETNPVEKASGCLKRFIDNGMITRDNASNVTILRYHDRQNSNLTGYERIKRYRQKREQTVLKNPTIEPYIGNDNEMITPGDNEMITPGDNEMITREERESRVDKKKTIVAKPLRSGSQPEVVKKNSTKEVGALVESKYDFDTELNILRNGGLSGKRKDFKVVALYWHRKGWKLGNSEQFNKALRRELRAASSLKGYSGEQIQIAIDYCSQNYPIWTLETVFKRITDLVNVK